jgi:tubulin-folding cofactor B
MPPDIILRLRRQCKHRILTNAQVTDTRPPGSRVDYNDVSKVEKYEMPVTEYESRTDSVLAWKKKQNLGRFDPNAPSLEQQKIQTLEREVEERGM